jgi:hypothetical protein
VGRDANQNIAASTRPSSGISEIPKLVIGQADSVCGRACSNCFESQDLRGALDQCHRLSGSAATLISDFLVLLKSQISALTVIPVIPKWASLHPIER